MKKSFILIIFLFFISNIYAEKVFISLKNSKDVQILEINEVLSIGYNSYASEIKFENDNPNIKQISLLGTKFISDYSFIEKCKNLEVIILNDISLDNLDFLEKLETLKVISCDNVYIKKLPSLKKIKNLEFFSFTNSNLTDCKKIMNHESKLKFVNLNFNQIWQLPKIKFNDKTIYFVEKNKITYSPYKNYIFENTYQYLPKKYFEYLK